MTQDTRLVDLENAHVLAKGLIAKLKERVEELEDVLRDVVFADSWGSLAAHNLALQKVRAVLAPCAKDPHRPTYAVLELEWSKACTERDAATARADALTLAYVAGREALEARVAALEKELGEAQEIACRFTERYVDAKDRAEEFKRTGQRFERESRQFFEQSCKNLDRAREAEAELLDVKGERDALRREKGGPG